jgi:hypothetical protein
MISILAWFTRIFRGTLHHGNMVTQILALLSDIVALLLDLQLNFVKELRRSNSHFFDLNVI